MAGTEGAIVMMTQLLNNDDVSGVEADMWITSLSLVQAPTEGVIRAVSTLLRKVNIKMSCFIENVD